MVPLHAHGVFAIAQAKLGERPRGVGKDAPNSVHQVSLRLLPRDDMKGLPFLQRQPAEDDMRKLLPELVPSGVHNEERNHNHLLPVTHDQQFIRLALLRNVGRLQSDTPRGIQE